MSTGAPTPQRTLLVLTAAVLATHLWLLRSPPARIHVREATRAARFSTRSINTVWESVTPAVAPPSVQPLLSKRVAAETRGPSRGTAVVPPRPPLGLPQSELADSADADARAAPPRLGAGGPEPVARNFAVPQPVRLRYAVTAQTKRERTQGSSDLSWEHDGETYEARLEVTAPGLPPRVQHSSGRITADGLAPLRFSEKTRTEQATHFERDAQRLSFSNNQPATALLAGAQDRLSVLLQLGAIVAGAPHRFPAGTSVVVQTATTREADPWTFTVDGEERLELPGGSLPTIKLVRPPRREFDQRIEVWLAPGLDYVPVRLRLTQPNGDWVDQQWSSTDRR